MSGIETESDSRPGEKMWWPLLGLILFRYWVGMKFWRRVYRLSLWLKRISIDREYSLAMRRIPYSCAWDRRRYRHEWPEEGSPDA